MSKQLQLEKIVQKDLKVENNSSERTQRDFGESKKMRPILEKCFPPSQVFLRLSDTGSFLQRETSPHKTHTRDLIHLSPKALS